MVGLGLVLANRRFDSPVLVAAATVSVVLLVIRTIVGYLNARVSETQFWSAMRLMAISRLLVEGSCRLFVGPDIVEL